MSIDIPHRGQRITDLTSALIRHPSTKENFLARSSVLDEAAKRLDGFTREQFDHNGVRSDLYYLGSTRPEKFRVLLHAHLDVVPAQKESQYIPKIRRGKLIGRGAQDMKSGAAALIEVFRDIGSQLPYPIGLSLTTDEEIGGFNGAGHQVEQGVTTDFVISGESTNLEIGNQHKGVIILSLDAKANGGHTAYDGDDANALQQLITFLNTANLKYPGPDGSWRTTSSVTKVATTNDAHNVVPDIAAGELAIRWVPQDNPDRIQETIAAIDSRISIRRSAFGVAHLTEENHPDLILLTKAIKQVRGKNATFSAKSGSSDLRHWTAIGAAGSDFGPIGDGLHTDHEYAEIDSFEPYATVLEHFLRSIH